MSIVVACGSEDMRRIVSDALVGFGHKNMILAESMPDIFGMLQKPSGGKDGIDIELMLMNIDSMDVKCFNDCRRIRETPALQDVPLILLGEGKDEGFIRDALDSGATDYVVSPFHNGELYARVHHALLTKREVDKRKTHERDMKELLEKYEEVNQRIERFTSLDVFTGVANRTYFEVFFDAEWKRAARNTKPLSLIMAQADFFKAFVETCGYMNGQAALKRIAKVLDDAVKRPGDFIARYDSDRLAVVLPDTHVEGALKLAENMRKTIEGLCIKHSCSNISDYLTVSMGAASMVPTRNSEPRIFLGDAERALYRAVREGRNRVRVSSISSHINSGSVIYW